MGRSRAPGREGSGRATAVQTPAAVSVLTERVSGALVWLRACPVGPPGGSQSLRPRRSRDSGPQGHPARAGPPRPGE